MKIVESCLVQFLLLTVIAASADISTMTTPLTPEQLKFLIRQEIRNEDYESYIVQLLTGTGLETRVKSLVQARTEPFKTKMEEKVETRLKDFRENIRDQVKGLVPREAREEIRTYLHDHLEQEVNRLLSKLLPTLLPSLVKAEMLERVQSLSGVELLLKEHSAKVNERLEGEYRYLEQQRLLQLAKIKELTDIAAADFTNQANAVATSIVNSLVSSNGSIIKGFSDSLAAENGRRFEKLQRDVDIRLMESRKVQLEQAREITSLHSGLSWAWNVNLAIIVAMGTLVFLKFKQ